MTAVADQPDPHPKRNVTYNAMMIATAAQLDRIEREIATAKARGDEALASRLADRALRMAGY